VKLEGHRFVAVAAHLIVLVGLIAQTASSGVRKFDSTKDSPLPPKSSCSSFFKSPSRFVIEFHW
jgi:hypothetical protein